MKKKSPGIVPNKSLEIRKTAREIILQGKPPRPIEIILRLKKKGITVSSPQVSTALKGTELAFRQYRQNWEKMPLPPKDMPPLEDLSKAQDFVRNMGSLEKAMNALSVFSLFKQETPEQEQYYGGA